MAGSFRFLIASSSNMLAECRHIASGKEPDSFCSETYRILLKPLFLHLLCLIHKITLPVFLEIISNSQSFLDCLKLELIACTLLYFLKSTFNLEMQICLKISFWKDKATNMLRHTMIQCIQTISSHGLLNST